MSSALIYQRNQDGTWLIKPHLFGDRTMPALAPPWELSRDGAFGMLNAGYEYAFSIVAKFLAQQQKLDENTGLSAEGRTAALLEIAPELVLKLKARLADVDKFETDLETRRAAIRKLSVPGDPVAAGRHQEIRAWFKGLSRQEKIGALHDAISQEDTEVLNTLLDSPQAFRLLDDEARAMAQKAVAGPQVERLEELEEAKALATGALESAVSHIVGAVGQVPAAA